jgi:hypothetical protein
MPGHVFDTGASAAQRTRVRDAILQRLLPLKALYVRALAPVPMIWQGRADEKGLAMLLEAGMRAAPAVYVGLGRKNYEPGGNEDTEVRGALQVGVYVVSGNQRSLVEGRLSADTVATGIAGDGSDADTTADPGIDIMLEHVEELLIGYQLPVDGVTVLESDWEDEIGTFDKVTIWGIHFTIHVERRIDPARGITQLVTEIETGTTPDTSPNLPTDPAFVTTLTTLDPED